MRFHIPVWAVSLISLLLLFVALRKPSPGKSAAPDPSSSILHNIPACTNWTCFNLTQCVREFDSHPLNRITVFVYPTIEGDGGPNYQSAQYAQLLNAIRISRYAVDDPSKACLYIPSIDLLNGFSPVFKQSMLSLSRFPWWNNGVNHLIFNFIPSSFFTPLGYSIIASGGHTTKSYRPTFDVAIPVLNPLNSADPVISSESFYLLTVLPTFANSDRNRLELLLESYRDPKFHGNQSILVIEKANTDHDRRSALFSPAQHASRQHLSISYAVSLAHSTFCLLIRISPLGQLALFDAMSFGCIPVIADDLFILPFSEVLDWSRLAIRISNRNLEQVPALLTSLNAEKISRYRRQVRFIFDRYFASVAKIALTALDILNDRVFPQYAKTYRQWNFPGYAENLFLDSSPLFYPAQSPTELGFTALIRACDNFALLRSMLIQLHNVPSLRRIVVVWTNLREPPPHVSLWPVLDVSLSIVQENVTNRLFFPHPSIITEAVLFLDDYACLSSFEQIQLAFSLWAQNPDQLVGIAPVHSVPIGRTNSADTPSQVMATFEAVMFHKHYLHSHTELLSKPILLFVNRVGICEQLVMNWLIVQLTGKPVLVVHEQSSQQPKSFRPIGCLRDRHLLCAQALVDDGIELMLLKGKPFLLAPWTVSRFQ